MDIVNWIRRKSWTVAVRDVGDLEGGAERDRRFSSTKIKSRPRKFFCVEKESLVYDTRAQPP